MRELFFNSLINEMRKNDKIYFLTADMGMGLVEQIEREFPRRYLNVGIAEQNLIGVAAGLAESGFRPYVYTISNFLVHRCLEQIRNDLILHKLPVVLVGTSTGFDHGSLGPTHHIVDDWGVLANFPGLDVKCPYDEISVQKIWNESVNTPRPMYVRIPKGNGFHLNSSEVSKYNEKNIVISYGSALALAGEYAKSKSAKLLATEDLGLGINKKLDAELADKKIESITIFEDHFPWSGLYSYVCQWVVQRKLNIEVLSVAPHGYATVAGIPDFEDEQW